MRCERCEAPGASKVAIFPELSPDVLCPACARVLKSRMEAWMAEIQRLEYLGVSREEALKHVQARIQRGEALPHVARS